MPKAVPLRRLCYKFFMEQSPRKRTTAIAIPLIFAMLLLTQTTARPSLANARAVDILSLVVVGFLLGVATTHAVALLRGNK